MVQFQPGPAADSGSKPAGSTLLAESGAPGVYAARSGDLPAVCAVLSGITLIVYTPVSFKRKLPVWELVVCTHPMPPMDVRYSAVPCSCPSTRRTDVCVSTQACG